MKIFLRTAFLLAVAAQLSLAQHGTAEPGYYPPGYNGDTWTGTVSAISEATSEITLTYDHHGKTETFVGQLDPHYTVKTRDGKSHELRVSEIPLGSRLIVYYRVIQKKINGQKAKTNEIFRLQALPAAR